MARWANAALAMPNKGIAAPRGCDFAAHVRPLCMSRFIFVIVIVVVLLLFVVRFM